MSARRFRRVRGESRVSRTRFLGSSFIGSEFVLRKRSLAPFDQEVIVDRALKERSRIFVGEVTIVERRDNLTVGRRVGGLENCLPLRPRESHADHPQSSRVDYPCLLTAGALGRFRSSPDRPLLDRSRRRCRRHHPQESTAQ